MLLPKTRVFRSLLDHLRGVRECRKQKICLLPRGNYNLCWRIKINPMRGGINPVVRIHFHITKWKNCLEFQAERILHHLCSWKKTINRRLRLRIRCNIEIFLVSSRRRNPFQCFQYFQNCKVVWEKRQRKNHRAVILSNGRNGLQERRRATIIGNVAKKVLWISRIKTEGDW